VSVFPPYRLLCGQIAHPLCIEAPAGLEDSSLGAARSGRFVGGSVPLRGHCFSFGGGHSEYVSVDVGGTFVFRWLLRPALVTTTRTSVAVRRGFKPCLAHV
jgi:hypothetical protein